MNDNANTQQACIGICADHAGFFMKEFIRNRLERKGLAYKDFGAFGPESSDYPDFAHPMAAAIESGEVYCGIAFCGSGNGINIVMNKHQGVRSALCWTEEIARLARQHNNANSLSLPARFVSQTEAEKIVDAFLSTEFEGGRHQRRIDKIPVC